LACANDGQPLFTPLAPTRLVLATRGAGNQLLIRMSGDGLVWTEPSTVTVDGAAAQTVATPSIFNDGTLYNLIWLAPDGAVRFATSRDATAWAVQASPLARLPPGSQPVLAQLSGRYFAASNISGTVSLLDLASSTGNRITVTQGAVGPVSVANTNAGLVLATLGSDRGVHVFTSTDGTTWTERGVVSAAAIGPGSPAGLAIGWGGGSFALVTRRDLGGSDIDVVHCKLFESADAVTWTERPGQRCSNSSAGQLVTRFGNHTLFYDNFSMLPNLIVSVDAGPLGDLHIVDTVGAPSVTTGGGPQLAWLNLDQIAVANGSGQNLTLVTLGFKARIGVANSAHVAWPAWYGSNNHRLDQFARRSASSIADVPPHDSPYAWFVTPATNLTQPQGQLDVMGAVVIGIDRGGCPEGPILNAIEQARAAFEASLNARLVTTPITTLQMPAQAKAVFDGIKADVARRLGGSPGGGGPIDWLKGAVDSFGKFVVCDVINSLGGGVDEQLNPASIVLLGTAFASDDPPNETFALSTRSAPLSPLLLQNDDHSKQWIVSGTRNFLSVP
jgi:hypothetical protein